VNILLVNVVIIKENINVNRTVLIT